MHAQLRSHSVKTARLHREREYFKKEHQELFHGRLRASIDLILQLLKDAFKRDQAIVDNLFKSHFMPSGSGLMVKPETHEMLKQFRDTVIAKGFKKPHLPIYNEEYVDSLVNLSFGGSDHVRQVQFNSIQHKKSRTEVVDSDAEQFYKTEELRSTQERPSVKDAATRGTAKTTTTRRSVGPQSGSKSKKKSTLNLKHRQGSITNIQIRKKGQGSKQKSMTKVQHPNLLALAAQGDSEGQPHQSYVNTAKRSQNLSELIITEGPIPDGMDNFEDQDEDDLMLRENLNHVITQEEKLRQQQLIQQLEGQEYQVQEEDSYRMGQMEQETSTEIQLEF